VYRPREQAVDTELLVVLAGYGVQLAKGLTPGATAVRPSEFLDRLKLRFATGWAASQAGAEVAADSFDWAALGRAVGPLLRTAPSSAPHMLGSLDTAVKVRKAAVRKPKDAVAPMARPDALADTGETGRAQQEMEAAVKAMMKVLKGCGAEGCCALRLVFNAASYAQTVENIFTLSFLVKDCFVKLSRGPRGKGVKVSALGKSEKEPSKEDYASGAAASTQFVLRLDQADWEAAKARLPVQPLMPHREPPVAGAPPPPPPVTSDQQTMAAAKGKRKLNAPRRVEPEEEEEEEAASDEEPVARKRQR